ncbi:RND transporter [Acidithiobacillus ferrivorans]|uniref:efflux transporter outer membrane subunit n=1 Tax=Acidithiobacillus ferrivorans TaxID=160808 RepID=UPI000893B4CB|nr:efflux transporter outer membrane subunit [Acidithiobacillus ferrivorans]OFA17191.1 RND transporter [Acidithiobacillus ferrivorans]
MNNYGSYAVRGLVLAMAMLLLSACAPTVHAPNPQDVRAPAFNRTLSALQQQAQLPADTWPQIQWWHALNDPQLDRIMAQGLSAQNPRLAAAADTVRWAAAMRQWRGAALGPQIGVTAAVTPMQYSGHGAFGALGLGNTMYDSGSVGLGFSQALDFWGKRQDQLNAAIGVQQAAQARLADTRRLLAAALLDNYLRWVGAIRQERYAQALQSLIQQQINLEEVRRRLGLSSDLPLQRLYVQVQQTESLRAQWQTSAAAARFALAELAGMTPDALPLQPTPVRAELSPALPAHLSLDLIAHRPDVQAAQALAMAAAASTKAARAEFYPDISFSALLDIDSAHLATLFVPGSFAYAFGPALHLPIFTGGALKGRFHGAEAHQAQAVALYREQILLAIRQVLTALSTYQGDSRERLAQNRVLLAAEQQVRLVQERVQDGIADQATLLAEQEQLLRQKMRQEAADIARLQSWAQLECALGGGYGRS